MEANKNYKNLPLEFWANVKRINQKVGYSDRKTKNIKIPTQKEVVKAYSDMGLNSSKIVKNDKATKFGEQLFSYFEYRANILNSEVKSNLMNADQAKLLFEQLRENLRPTCPIPMNKQKGDKKAPAYFTSIINMIIEANLGEHNCDYDPRELTAVTDSGYPLRVLSRRVDGAFPNIINPKAIWEIKEYYYTTTFGSRVADGVYETIVDGFELNEIKQNLNIDIKHYLFVDAYYTWWDLGRSYLCRIIDLLHMGILDEAIFGKEVVTRLPVIIQNLVKP
ncbi:MAG: hypothetical protein KAH48_01055 [Chlorobi bacterium]|nr:hypothetical protein [Chlorobiota bacterium]